MCIRDRYQILIIFPSSFQAPESFLLVCPGRQAFQRLGKLLVGGDHKFSDCLGMTLFIGLSLLIRKTRKVIKLQEKRLGQSVVIRIKAIRCTGCLSILQP